jgi:hypothetical protein
LTGSGLKSTSSRNRLNRSRQVLKPVRAKNNFFVNYNCYEACISIIFSFVLGPCCYSGWHWLHLERNRQAGWAA